MREKGITSAVLSLEKPLCDWNDKPVREVELLGEEGAPIATELAKVAGMRVRVDTSDIFERLLRESDRTIWATYVQGSVRAD